MEKKGGHEVKRRNMSADSLDTKTLAYWNVSRAARGFSPKTVTVGKALETVACVLEALGPHRKLKLVAGNLQQELVNHGGATPRRKKSAPSASVLKFKAN